MDIIYSQVDPPTVITNQEHVPYVCPQANCMRASSQEELPLLQVTAACVKLTEIASTIPLAIDIDRFERAIDINEGCICSNNGNISNPL